MKSSLLALLGLRRHLISGGVSSFAAKIAGAFAAFLASVGVARWLGAEQFGQYVIALSWANLLLVVSVHGMDTVALRFVPRIIAAEEGTFWPFRRVSRRRVFVGALLAASALAIVLLVIGAVRGEKPGNELFLVCALLPITSALVLSGSTLVGLGRPVTALALDSVLRPSIVAAGAFAFIFLAPGLARPEVALALQISAAIVALTAITLSISRAAPARVAAATGVAQKFEWNDMLLAFAAIAGFQVLLAQTDIIMLGWLAGAKEAGLYAPAMQLSRLQAFALAAANLIVTPQISRLFSENRMAELQALLSKGVTTVAVLALPLFLIILVMGRPILSLYGPEFLAVFPALTVLLVGQLYNCLSGSVGSALTMTNYHVQALIFLCLTAVVNIVLNAVLIPLYGPLGAAIATATSLVTWNLSMTIFVRRRLNLRPTILGVFSARSA